MTATTRCGGGRAPGYSSCSPSPTVPNALRKPLWSLLTLALALGALEGLARWAEVIAPEASIPDPGEFDLAFQQELARRRRTVPDLPLVEEDTRGWALEPGRCSARRAGTPSV